MTLKSRHKGHPYHLLERTEEPLSKKSLEGPSTSTLFGLEHKIFTIEEAIDHIGIGKFHYKLLGFLILAEMADAMEMMLLTIFSPVAKCIWNLQPWEEAFISTVVFFALIVGAPFWGWFSDNYGRKTGIYMSITWVFYFGLLSAFVPDYKWILIVRFLVGFGIGGVNQILTLYSEFLPIKQRGMFLTFSQFSWAIGTSACAGLATIVMPTLGWRWFLGLLTVPALIVLLAFKKFPESCRYLLLAGKREEALALLQRIAEDNGSSLPGGTLVESPNKTSRRGQFIDLVSEQHRITTFLLLLLWTVAVFTYYGAALISTEFINGDGCSVSPIGKETCGCNLPSTSDYAHLFLTTLAEFPGLFLILLVDNIGRKKMISATCAAAAVCFSLLLFCGGRFVMMILLFSVRMLTMSFLQVVFIYTAEVYPTKIRAVAIGTLTGVSRLGGMLSPFVSQVLLQISVPAALSVFALVCFLCLLTSIALPTETKDRELQEY